MKTRKQSAAEWWAGLAPEGRSFVRDIAWMVESLLGDEVLELKRRGPDFYPVMKCKTRPFEAPGPEWLHPKLRPDGWWAGLAPAGKDSFRTLARLVCMIRQGESLRISRSGCHLSVTLVFTIRAKGRGPVGGRAELN